MKKIKVLFVCMGNICRSPTAQGVFQKQVTEAGLADHIEISSAGTHAYHIGDPPDMRTQQVAQRRGVNLSNLRARRVRADDIKQFDYVVAMDQDNYRELQAICPDGYQQRLHLLLDFAPELGTREVPDPYYGGPGGFERVFDLVEAAARGLLAEVRRQLD
ncbi:low molecular weight protein-tyrosine-phosphatase [Thiospirillum jenense]|uniref:protein-tyrosine-phosphatase n=1 Tax=Thiospirillum jenense TaxID=1653858 RepID=A0A839H520_9GAMM|nr:low molecular weight protein-tyrosine-phosphatase [Thiospirillum jenense]MBB1125125.1 low molecular weight phosphotyrosine protein phosphatase [Thiospirillum jenense]